MKAPMPASIRPKKFPSAARRWRASARAARVASASRIATVGLTHHVEDLAYGPPKPALEDLLKRAEKVGSRFIVISARS
jgi:hypothetical protein